MFAIFKDNGCSTLRMVSLFHTISNKVKKTDLKCSGSVYSFDDDSDMDQSQFDDSVGKCSR